MNKQKICPIKLFKNKEKKIKYNIIEKNINSIATNNNKKFRRFQIIPTNPILNIKQEKFINSIKEIWLTFKHIKKLKFILVCIKSII